MNRNERRQLRPNFDPMESRITPVGFFSRAQVLFNEEMRDRVSAAAVEHAQRIRVIPPRPEVGAVSGTYQLSSSTLDANTTGTVTGTGTLSPHLGNVTFSGKIGPIATSRPGTIQGVVTLTNDQGSLTLVLTAKLPRNVSALGNLRTAQVNVAGGTGAYANAIGLGAGVARLNFNPVESSDNTGTFSVTIRTPRIRGIS